MLVIGNRGPGYLEDVITQAVDEVVVRIGVLRYGYLVVNDQDVFMAIIRVKWGCP
jgi:hypothetical protein